MTIPDEVSNGSRRSGAAPGPSRGGSPANGRGRIGPLPGRPRRRVTSGHRITTSESPSSTVCPTETSTRSTVPSRGARSSFSIFIASTARSRWPAVTASPGVTATDTTRPGMMARTAVGPWWSPPIGRPSPAPAGRRSGRPRPPPRSASRPRRPRPGCCRGPWRRRVRRQDDGALAGRVPVRAGASAGSISAMTSPRRRPRPAAGHRGHRSMASSRAGGRPAALSAGRRWALVGRAVGPDDGRGGTRRSPDPVPRTPPATARAARPPAATATWPARPAPSHSRRPSPSTGRPAGTRRAGPRTYQTAGSSGCRAISVSSRARRRRSMAAGRSPAWTMTLASRLS